MRAIRFPSAPIDRNTLNAIHASVRALNEFLLPAPPEAVSARVVGLLEHYYTRDTPEQLQRIVANDWLRLLQPFPFHAIDKACLRYLSDNPRRKPGPGDIEALLMESVGVHIARRDKLQAIATAAVRGQPEPEESGRRTPEETAAGLEMFAKVKAILNSATDDLKSNDSERKETA